MTNTLLAEKTAQLHTQEFGEYSVVTSFGDVQREYAAIRGAVGIFDFSSHGRFKVSGDNHREWLSHLVSRDLEYANSETVMLALVLDEQATVLGIVSLYIFDDAILVEAETPDRARLAAWFNEHREDGVVVDDVSDEYGLIGLEGPHSFKVVQTLIDFEISSIPFQGFVEIDWQEASILLARTGYTGEYGYKLFVPSEQALAFWHALYAEVEKQQGAPCGNEALEMTMVEVRQPVSSLDGKDLPVTTAGLGWLVDFNKADAYIGQQAIDEQASAALTQRIIGFTAAKDAQIAVDDQVMLGDEHIGRVLHAFYSPTLDAVLGLALNKEPFTVTGLTFQVRKAEGEAITVQTTSSPYVLPKSWKVKML